MSVASLRLEASELSANDASSLKAFSPLTSSNESPQALIALGRMLYYDGRISPNGQSSCNSCHILTQYGATAAPSGTGASGKAKSVGYHGAAQLAQFSKGREAPHNPLAKEMSPLLVVATLKTIDGYTPYFERAFPDAPQPVTFEHVVAALDAFRQGLVRPGVWDDYLRGKESALSAEQMEGAKLFNKLGCVECHTGEYVGGLIIERSRAQAGRNGKRKLNVPSLRNVQQTAPYFRDGSAPTVEEAIRVMGKTQLGLDLKAQDVNLIAGWLRSLTSAIPSDYIARPALPGELPSAPD